MKVIGSVYVEVSDRFQKGIIRGISRCVKAEKTRFRSNYGRNTRKTIRQYIFF